jgi:carbon-monoxide dehydrogenase large subunit
VPVGRGRRQAGQVGGKSATYPEYLALIAAARRLDRPVRWVEDRAEALTGPPNGRGQLQRIRLAAAADGRILALDLHIDADVGGYPHTGTFIPTATAMMASGAYRIPEVHVRARAVVTTTAPTAPYRGAGRPEAAYCIERTVDRLARRLGLDPAELRRRNHIPPEDFPYRSPTGFVYDSGGYTAALEKALAAVDYEGWRRRQRQRPGEIGIGICTYVERTGAGPEYGAVEACPDGTYIATTGCASTGQGHETAFPQVVASVLGVPVERVRLVQADTAKVPKGIGTFASRSMQTAGAALWRAATRLRAEGGTKAEEWYEPPQAFPFGAYVAVVEVDRELGAVRVLRLVAVDDVGVVVNPLLVEGQGYGSVVQGLGQALYELADHDEQGRPRSVTLLDYLLPTITELPPVTLGETCTPNPNTPLGAKGAGEAGCIGVPPAVLNAIADALGVDEVPMPATPDAVWRATPPVVS